MGWRDLLPWNKPKNPLTLIATYNDDDEGDRMVLEQLFKASADLSQPREIIHYLYLPTKSSATVAAENLQLCGYTSKIGMAANANDNPPNPWLVLATIHGLANADTIRAARRIFEELAAKLDGEYDGWEAAARP